MDATNCFVIYAKAHKRRVSYNQKLKHFVIGDAVNEPDIAALLALLRRRPEQKVPEATVFSIGARGHFENPTTDILAFYCDTNAQHELDDLMLRALFESISESVSNYWLVTPPERECRTRSGKRIDLLLEGDDWVLVVENKINHLIDNPFDEYERYIFIEQNVRFKDKRPVFVVLSPDGVAPAGHDRWIGLSFEQLINTVTPKLAKHFIAKPLNKWSILLREFVLHLEGLLIVPKLQQENIEFVLENYQSIKAINELRVRAFPECGQQLASHLESVFDVTVKLSLISRWNRDNDAMRFALLSWSERNKDAESDVVIFMSEASPQGMALTMYILLENEKREAQLEFINQMLQNENCRESDIEDNYAWYRFEPFVDTKLSTMKVELENKIRLLDEIERELRG